MVFSLASVCPFVGLFLKLYIFCIFVLIRDFTILLNVVISFFLSCWDQIFPPFLAVFIIFTRNLSLSSLVLSYLTKLIKIKPMLSSPHPTPTPLFDTGTWIHCSGCVTYSAFRSVVVCTDLDPDLFLKLLSGRVGTVTYLLINGKRINLKFTQKNS